MPWQPVLFLTKINCYITVLYWHFFCLILILKQKSNLSKSKQTVNFVKKIQEWYTPPRTRRFCWYEFILAPESKNLRFWHEINFQNVYFLKKSQTKERCALHEIMRKNSTFYQYFKLKTKVILSSAVSNSWKTENATHFKVSLVFCFRGHFQLWCQKVKAFGEPKVIAQVFLVEQDTIEFSFSIFVFLVYREVMSSNTSRLNVAFFQKVRFVF